jgi:hypothetical protein
MESKKALSIARIFIWLRCHVILTSAFLPFSMLQSCCIGAHSCPASCKEHPAILCSLQSQSSAVAPLNQHISTSNAGSGFFCPSVDDRRNDIALDLDSWRIRPPFTVKPLLLARTSDEVWSQRCDILAIGNHCASHLIAIAIHCKALAMFHRPAACAPTRLLEEQYSLMKDS